MKKFILLIPFLLWVKEGHHWEYVAAYDSRVKCERVIPAGSNDYVCLPSPLTPRDAGFDRNRD